MSEQQPLHLIQRAIKRLGGQNGDGLGTPRPARDAESRYVPPLQGDVRRAERPVGHIDGHSRPVRLNYAELRRRGMITPDNMSSSLSYEFRSIKRKLLVGARDPKSRALVNNLIMITSSLPREGKTFTAVNLAFSLAAERDLQVLLVDGDVIRPAVSELFEATDGKGLVDLLSGNCRNVSDVMHRCTDMPNLSIIFSGLGDHHTPELVASHRMADLFADLSRRYTDRIIIVDTPPVLASVEAASIAMHVHQLIMVVASEQTGRTQLQKALESVSACRNLSLLFNKAPKWRQIESDSYYYYGGAGAARGG